MTQLIASEYPVFSERSRFPDTLVEGVGVIQKIEKVVKTALCDFQDAISRAFHSFYQQRAEIHNISRDHCRWCQTLKSARESILEDWNDVKRCYPHIPAISDPVLKAKALTEMLFLETLMPALIKRSEELEGHLKDPAKQESLQNMKVIIAELESLAVWDNVVLDFVLRADSREVKVEKLTAIEKKLEGKELHPLLIRFINYVGRSLRGTLYDPPYKEFKDGKEVALETAPLITEESFRTGSLIGVSYINISDVVEEVTKVESAVKAANSRLFAAVRNACEGRDALSEASLDAATLVLNHAYNALQTKPFSTHVHAGMYYEDAVRIHLSEVRLSFEQMKLQLEGSFGCKARTLNCLATYLHAPADQLHEKIDSLYKVCMLASKLPLLKDETIILEQTIAKEGNAFLKFTSQEKLFHKQIFERSLSWHESEDALSTYLMKGFLLNIFFREESFQDTEFEAAFFMLKMDPAYKRGFEEALKTSPILKALHDSYMSRYDREGSSPLLCRIKNALVMWHAPLPKGTRQDARAQDAMIRIYKLEELILALQEKTKLERARKRMLEQMVLSYKQINGKDFLCKQEQKTCLSELLHPSLLKELFNCYAPYIKGVRELVGDKLFSLNEVQGLTRLLLQRWKLDDLMKMGEKSSLQKLADKFSKKNEEEILSSLFTEFLTSEEARSTWRCQYDFGTLEILLYKYYKTKDDKKALKQARAVGYELWEQIVSSYMAFREILNEHESVAPDTKEHETAADLYTKAQSTFLSCNTSNKTFDGENHVCIAASLLLEMKEFLTNRRFSHSKELLTYDPL